MKEDNIDIVPAPDPKETFRALRFPEDIVKLAYGAEEFEEKPPAALEASASTEAHAAPSDEEIRPAATWLDENQLLGHENLKYECAKAERSSKSGVVAGFIPRRAVSFLIGDSGIGKSPLAYQLGLSVAAGVPFLGMETQPGLVVMCDYENGMEESLNYSDQLARFLKLPEVPQGFVVWSPDYSHTDSVNIERICETAVQKPTFVIVDSLRSHDPHFEKHEYAGEKMNKLNKLAYKYGTAILVIHHTRKPDRENPVSDLADDKTRVIRWLREAAG